MTDRKRDRRGSRLSPGAVCAAALTLLAGHAGAQQVMVPIQLDAGSGVAAELCIGAPLNQCDTDATQLFGGLGFVIDRGANTITIAEYSVNSQESVSFSYGGLGTNLTTTLSPFTAMYPEVTMTVPTPGVIAPDGAFTITDIPGVITGTATALGVVAFIFSIDETIDLGAQGEFVGAISGTINEPSPGEFVLDASLQITVDDEVESIPLTLTVDLSLSGTGTGVEIACPADFNGDGMVNILDVVAFINNWNAQGPGSDFNDDKAVNILDVLAFVNTWNAGCP